jgi:large subunit ribosomal protein L31e
MAEKTNTEREYVIPLREKCRPAARYKKTPKAVKTIKEFLARHMKVYDRDLRKIKIDSFLNEYLWFRGIKSPPSKVKVKARKEGENVIVELAEMPNKLKFKKLREEKIDIEAKAKVESKKSMMQKAKEGMKPTKKTEKEVNAPESEDKDKDGVKDKLEEKEKKEAVKEEGEKIQEKAEKDVKKTSKIKIPKEEIAQDASNKASK